MYVQQYSACLELLNYDYANINMVCCGVEGAV